MFEAVQGLADEDQIGRCLVNLYWTESASYYHAADQRRGMSEKELCHDIHLRVTTTTEMIVNEAAVILTIPSISSIQPRLPGWPR